MYFFICYKVESLSLRQRKYNIIMSPEVPTYDAISQAQIFFKKLLDEISPGPIEDRDKYIERLSQVEAHFQALAKEPMNCSSSIYSATYEVITTGVSVEMDPQSIQGFSTTNQDTTHLSCRVVHSEEGFTIPDTPIEMKWLIQIACEGNVRYQVFSDVHNRIGRGKNFEYLEEQQRGLTVVGNYISMIFYPGTLINQID